MGEFVTFGETPLLLSPPRRARLERTGELQVRADGVESNAAVAAHALGTRAVWVSVLPDSPLGHRVRSAVDAEGVRTDVSWVDPTGCRQALVFGESTRQPRERRRLRDQTGTPIAAVTPEDLPMDRVRGADMLLTGLNTAVRSQESAETTTALLRAGRGGGARTAVALEHAAGLDDPEVYRGVFEELAAEADITFVGEADARAVLDLDDRWRDLASRLTVEYGLDIAVVFRSGHGAVAMEDSTRAGVVHERAGAGTEPVDTAGEYGALVGGVCSGLLGGDTIATALDTGLAAAGLVRAVDSPFLSVTDGGIDAAIDRVVDGQ